MTMTNMSGFVGSAQYAKIGMISDLDSANFSLSDGQPFHIKNDSIDKVTLEVNLKGMDEGEYIETVFEPGWNPEIIREIKLTSLLSLNLKYGY